MNKSIVQITGQPLLRLPVRALRRLHALYTEQALNVDTQGYGSFGDSLPASPDALPYEGTPYHVLAAIFRRLPFDTKSEVLADYGCGKGRVVSFASRHAFRRVIGIELNPRLAEIARRNAAAARGRRTPVEIIQSDVLQFDCRDVTVFFYFNPFGARTTQQVLANIHASLQENPRRILIVLYNPVQSELFRACPWLRQNHELGFEDTTVFEAPHGDCVEFFECDGLHGRADARKC